MHQLLCEGYTDVAGADLSKYFDTIPHAELLPCVARRISDRQVLNVIKRWLKTPVEEREENGKRRTTGGWSRSTAVPWTWPMRSAISRPSAARGQPRPRRLSANPLCLAAGKRHACFVRQPYGALCDGRNHAGETSAAGPPERDVVPGGPQLPGLLLVAPSRGQRGRAVVAVRISCRPAAKSWNNC